MSKQSLAVKYRPQRFEDVVEQDVVKSILGEQLKDKSFKNCLLFCGGAGTGKAQPLWSKVLTPNGFITMKEVQVGTEVVTGNGNIAKVTEIYPNQERPIYCITLGNRTMFHVADNHLNVIIIDNEERVVNTLELIDLLEKEETTHKSIFMYIYDDTNKSKTTTRVISVSLIEPKEECKCIYVNAEEHTYITDNYVVTHNTTSARIFANEINDFKGHVIEIDAASNNSVEHMRKIIEEARTQSLDSEYKVFVLDECFTGETEILTDKGFKQIKELDKTEKIAQYNDITGTVEFVTPLEYIEMPYEGTMYDFHSNDFSIKMSPHHVQCTCTIDKDTSERTIHEEYVEDFISDENKYLMLYRTDLNKVDGLYSTTLIENTPYDFKGTIYCVKVPTQKIIIRCGNFAFVSCNCHMLSNAAWNAMLKLIEEPPKKSVFMLCLDENGLVCTETGMKKIKDVSVGERVWTGDSFHSVSNVFNNGQKECLKITLQNGEYIKCTPNHKIKVLNGTHEIWKCASELTLDDVIAVYHSYGIFEDFPDLTNTECWFLGYLTGNGHYRDHSLEFYTPKHKLDFIHNKLDIGIKEGWLSHYEDVRDNGAVTTQIHFPKNSMRIWYAKTGCNYNYTRGNKEIPKCVYSMSTPQIMTFVQGWFDADGTGFGRQFLIDRPHPILSCASINMSHDLQQLLIAHGFDIGIYHRIVNEVHLPDGRIGKGEYHSHSLYNRHQSGYFVQADLMKWLFDHRLKDCTPHIPEARGMDLGKKRISPNMVLKSKLPDLQGNKWYNNIKSIENCGVCNVYDIEVPDVHEFIYNSVKVHNCTTDPQKIPATIISRVQRYQFQKISYEGIVSRLKYIISEENKEAENNITFEDSALEYIAKQADGGMRDAITLLDKAIGYSQELTIQNVLTALGSVSYETMFKLSTALDKMDAMTVIDVIEEVHGSGMDLKQFMKNYNYFVLDLCKYKLFRNFKYLQIPSIYEKFINQYDDNSFAFFNTLLNELLKLNDKLKWETLPKPLVESTLLNLCSEA